MYLKKSGCLEDGYFSEACGDCVVFLKAFVSCEMCVQNRRDCPVKVFVRRSCYGHRDSCAAVGRDGGA
jgi:hypothetical protein